MTVAVYKTSCLEMSSYLDVNGCVRPDVRTIQGDWVEWIYPDPDGQVAAVAARYRGSIAESLYRARAEKLKELKLRTRRGR